MKKGIDIRLQNKRSTRFYGALTVNPAKNIYFTFIMILTL